VLICGWGQLGKALAILLLKSIHTTQFTSTVHSNSRTNKLKVLKRIVVFFKDYKFVYKILHMVEEHPWWEKKKYFK